MKKTTTLRIDEDILNNAKLNIPNLSIFVEECFKAFLGVDNDVDLIQRELNSVKQSFLIIHLLSSKYKGDDVLNDDKVNEVWLKVWVNYNESLNFNSMDLKKLVEVIGEDEDFIMKMVEDLYLYIDKSEFVELNDWNTAYNKYLSLINNYKQ